MIYRTAQAEDALQISDIYRYYVENTAVTFAYDAPTEEEFRRKIQHLGKTHPFLVCEEEGRIAGFAYAAPYREKEAFQWDVELTIYLAPDACRKGLGAALMERLLRLLGLQGYLTAYSCVTLPNPGSEKLHSRFGFDTLGVHPRSGYKLGKWQDVIWLQKTLGDFPSEPMPPMPFASLDAPSVRRALE